MYSYNYNDENQFAVIEKILQVVEIFLQIKY